jgi:hypothetical protein
MKTPREILLKHHQTAEGRLDQIRQGVVAGIRRQETSANARSAARELPLLAAAALKLWRELVLPSRGIWAGLAAVWLVILGYNLNSPEVSVAMARGTTAPAQELRTVLKQYNQRMAEFALLPVGEGAAPSKQNPQPRSHLSESSRNT